MPSMKRSDAKTLIEEAGGEVNLLNIVGDTKEDIESAILPIF